MKLYESESLELKEMYTSELKKEFVFLLKNLIFCVL